MNLDRDFTNYDGYDSPEEDDQQRQAGANDGLDEEEEVTPSKRELLGDVEAEWVKSKRDKDKVDSRFVLHRPDIAQSNNLCLSTSLADLPRGTIHHQWGVSIRQLSLRAM